MIFQPYFIIYIEIIIKNDTILSKVDDMNNLKIARKTKQLTQKEVAQKLGISQNTYSYWESGKIKVDSAGLEKLCKIFETSADYLIGLSTSPKFSDNVLQKSEVIADDLQLAFYDASKKLSAQDRADILDYIQFKLGKKQNNP